MLGYWVVVVVVGLVGALLVLGLGEGLLV